MPIFPSPAALLHPHCPVWIVCILVVLITGIPLELIKPEALGHKVFEPLLLLGKQRWGFLDIRLRVKGGGHVSQIYGESSRVPCYMSQHANVCQLLCVGALCV